MRLIVAAALFAACAAAAWAQDVTPPRPSTAPAHNMTQICADVTGDRRFYPERAQERNLNGEAVLDCAVGEDKMLSSCQIVEESPAGYGFGESALAMACLWRLSTTGPNSRTYTDEATGEQRIRRPVRFRLH
jgi:protein TonB